MTCFKNFLCVAVGLALASLLLAACASVQEGAEEKGRSQVWEENCSRCHNFRDPSSYGDVQWQVILHHMRVRANLTADEHRMIREFLQASN